jgi:hypothetical protein
MACVWLVRWKVKQLGTTRLNTCEENELRRARNGPLPWEYSINTEQGWGGWRGRSGDAEGMED